MPVWMWWKLKVLWILAPLHLVAVLYTLIDQHDSVHFGFCPVSSRASHILSTPILFQSKSRIIESPIFPADVFYFTFSGIARAIKGLGV